MRLLLRQPVELVEPAFLHSPNGVTLPVFVRAPVQTFVAAAEVWAKATGGAWTPWLECRTARVLDHLEETEWLAKTAASPMKYDSEGAYRWVTVHPNGKDAKGQAVKIRESKTQKGVWHVVGGAGGKLNYLKLTNVKSVEEYKSQSKQKGAERRAGEREQKAKEAQRIASMSPEERAVELKKKTAARDELTRAEDETIKVIAERLGWAPEELAFDASKFGAVNATPEQIARLEKKHRAEIIKRLDQLDRNVVRRVLLDHEARAAMHLGDLPFTATDPKSIALSDLDPDKLEGGLGYTLDTTNMAEEQILAHLAQARVGDLDTQITSLEEAAATDPTAEPQIAVLKRERDLAVLLRDHPELDTKDLAGRDSELGDELAAVAAEQAEYAEELTTLQEKKGLSPAEQSKLEELQRQDEQAKAKAERLSELRDTVQQVSEAAGNVLELEAEAWKEERVAAAGGDLAAHREKKRERQEKLAEYQAEVKRLKDQGVIRKPDLSVDAAAIQDPDALLDVLRHMKQLKQLRKTLKAVEDAKKPIDEVLLGKPMFVETKEATKAQIAEAVRSELSERVTASFLDKVESLDEDPTLADLTGPEKRMAILRHVSLGSYNALNEASLTVLRQPVIPREVSDVLGAAGTAQLLARIIQEDRDPEDIMAIRDALGEHHKDTHVEAAKDAMAEAAGLYDQAREIQLGQIRGVSDLREMQSINARRREKLEQARAVLGRTLGELEGSAALVAAMDAPPVDHIEVAMGSVDADMVIRQARALGLQRGDYKLDSDGKNRFLTVNESGLSKLGGKWVDAKEAHELDEVEAIKRGDRDEDGWLPKGMKSWAKSAFDDPSYDPPSIADAGKASITPIENWSKPEDMHDWIGARYADGVPPDTILGELNGLFNRVPEAARAAIGKVRDQLFPTKVPLTGKDGRQVLKDGEPQMRSAFGPDYAEGMAKLAEGFTNKTFPGNSEMVPIHAQSLPTDGEDGKKVAESLYLSMADDPRLSLAFREPGGLDEQGAAAVRHYFNTEIAAKQEGVDKAALQKKLAEVDKEIASEEGRPPEGMQTAMFGAPEEEVRSPRLDTLKAQRQALVADSQDAAGIDWDSYVASHGSVEAARGAILDHMKDRLLTKFSKKHFGATKQKLRTAPTPMAGWQRHLAALDPSARAELRRSQKARSALQAQTQTRDDKGFAYMGGKGSARGKVDRAERADEWGNLNQTQLPGAEHLARGEALTRTSLGSRVEGQIKALIEGQGGDGGLSRNLGKHLNEPLDLFPNLSMSGKANIKGTEVDLAAQQRAIKMFKLRKRVGAFLGTGSGKTPISVGAFTDLASDPSTGVKRGLYVVPSQVQGQFHGEIGKFVEPGKFNWSADSGAEGPERIRTHRDPSQHMVVTTYESLRSDTMKMMHDQAPPEAQVSDDAMKEWFMGMDRKGRAEAVKKAFGGELPYQASFLDEGHVTLDRQGKPDSLLSNVLQAYSDSTPYYMAMTADPLKNDISEIRSQLDKIHPEGGYDDEGAWMRRYGVGTTAQRSALRREVGGNFFVNSVKLPTQAHRQPVSVALSTSQRAAYKNVMDQYDKIRLSQSRGQLDVEAVRQMVPRAFEGKPESEYEEIAKRVQDGLPMSRDAALRRIVNLTPAADNAKIQTIRQRFKEHPPSDKPAIIFAHNPEAVDMLAETLKADGHRVTTLTGSHTRKEKNARRQAFQTKNPKDATADIMILSDAGATGLNLQRGKQLIHYDMPMTAMVHNQRNGRIDRLGQTEDVDLLDLVTDTEIDQAAQKRVKQKYELKDIFTGDDGAVDESDLGAYLTKARTERNAVRAGKSARVA